MKLLSDDNLKKLGINNAVKQYSVIFKNVFDFDGLKPDVKEFMMEKLLYGTPLVAFNLKLNKEVDYKELALAQFVEKSWRWTETPLNVRVLNPRNAPNFPTDLTIGFDAVVIRLDFSPFNMIKERVQRIFDIQSTIDTNLTVHQMPFIVKSTDNKTIEAIKQIIKKSKVVFTEDGFIDVLKTDVPYIIDKLSLYRSEVEAELLTILGVDNVKFEKKAQMTKDEINANNEEISQYRKYYRRKLEDFFEQIKEILGHEITIKEEKMDEILEEESGDENV